MSVSLLVRFLVFHAQGLLQLSARGVTSSPVAASHFALLSLLKLTRKLRTRLNEMRDTSMKLTDRLALSSEGWSSVHVQGQENSYIIV